MAPRRKTICSLSSPSPFSIGNCAVTVEAKNFTSESSRDSLQISLSKTAKIRISVVEKVNEQSDIGSPETNGDCYFFLANPKDSNNKTEPLLQEVLDLYMNELPAMNYAANTGKRSSFLERCVRSGKYCTLLLETVNGMQSEEVIAAITYQIIPADTQYAEVPLAAVNSKFQRKGIGRFLYLELRRRLQSVGICTLYCWGDKESVGFWIKLGFKGIGEVDNKGKANRLPIKADVRKALCFPGGSTLMISHLLKDSPSEPVKFPKLCSPIKSPKLNYKNQELEHVPESAETSGPRKVGQRTEIGSFETERFATENLSVDGGHDVGLLPIAVYQDVANASDLRYESKDDPNDYSYLQPENKKRLWEASWTSLKSKKVKGTHSIDCQLGSSSSVWCSDGRIANSLDGNFLSTSGNKSVPDTLLKNTGSNYMQGKDKQCRTDIVANEDFCCTQVPSSTKCYRIMLMNIADEEKISCLSKIIEDLGGVLASEGNSSTHIVTGKARMTLNFCCALCSGAWVISPGWLKESFKKGKFVEETSFVLVDDDYKNKYRIELKTAVLRAKAKPKALFKGLSVWPAKHIQPPVNSLSTIVKSAGGNVIWTKDEVKDALKTIFVACEDDMEEAYLAVKMGVWTFSADWVMNCVMKQQLDFDAPQFAESL